MNTLKSPTLRLAVLGTAFLAFAALPVAALSATPDLQPVTDQAAKLPVATAFEKTSGGEGGPYVLKVTNTAQTELKVSAKVLLSVAFHADNKARMVPEHTLAAGETWTISDLAAKDEVILTAKDYAPLKVSVP